MKENKYDDNIFFHGVQMILISCILLEGVMIRTI